MNLPTRGVLGRLVVVAVLHAGVLYAVIQVNPQLKKELAPLVVRLIAPPPSAREAPPPAPPPRPRVKPTLEPAALAAHSTPAPSEPAPNAITIAAPPPSLPVPPGPPGPVPEAVRTAPPPAAPPPVVAPRFDAAYLNNPAPAYPNAARRRGEEGRVDLLVLVSVAGSALRVEVRTSTGFPLLDQTAMDAVGRWRFVPARQGDRPVEAWVVVPIVFAL